MIAATAVGASSILLNGCGGGSSPGGIPGPGVTRDNTNRLVVTAEAGGMSQLFTCNPDGSDWVRLSDGTQYDRDGAWSPDKTHVAFTTSRWSNGPDNQFLIATMDATGRSIQQVDLNGVHELYGRRTGVQLF
jgi:Tol biopolymer transport system component